MTRHPEVRVSEASAPRRMNGPSRPVALRGPRFARAPQGDGAQKESARQGRRALRRSGPREGKLVRIVADREGSAGADSLELTLSRNLAENRYPLFRIALLDRVAGRPVGGRDRESVVWHQRWRGEGDHRPVGPALVGAAGQNVGRVTPQRLGISVTKIAAGEADIGQHPVVELGQHRGVVTVFQDLSHLTDGGKYAGQNQSEGRGLIRSPKRSLK